MLVVPIIVTPYVSRVLGVDGVGQYSFANSIVSYFLLFAVLGTTTYGQRTIGYEQQNVENRSRAFWEIFIFRLITAFITLGAYGIYVALAVKNGGLIIYLILALNIFNVMVDISWFVQGMEDFKRTATTSIVFRVLSVTSIFLFVKSPSDLWLYVLFTVGFSVLSNMFLWIYMPKYLCRVKGIKPFRDIKSIIQLFLPTIAIQIYTVLDKSMIGWFADGFTENGYYEQAEKVVRMALTAVTALGVVMIPRISRKFKEGEIEQVNNYIYKSYRFVWMMAIPIMFGIIAVASIFVPIFFGEGYEKCIYLMPILSILTIFVGLSHVTNMQYLIPVGKQNVIIVTSITGAVVNIVLNLCLIPWLASIGAAIASVAAEFCVTAVGLGYIVKTKRYKLLPVLTCSWKYWIAGAVMTGLLFLIKIYLPVTVWALIVLIAAGALIYFIVLVIIRDKMLLEIISKGWQTVRSVFVRKRVKETVEEGEQPMEIPEVDGEQPGVTDNPCVDGEPETSYETSPNNSD